MFIITNRYRVTSIGNCTVVVRDIRVPCKRDVFYEYEASHKDEKIMGIKRIDERPYTAVYSNGFIGNVWAENLAEAVKNYTENMSDFDQLWAIYPVKIYDFENHGLAWIDPEYAGRPDLIERAENGDDIRREDPTVCNL